LPPGPRFYPEDAVIDRPLEFVLSEFVREQLYTATRQELPFATAVHVEELQQGEELRLVASIFVEKPSQKGIVIGAGAAVIKAIRERATRRIEKFVGHSQVKVELTVKVKRNWRSDPAVLRSLWYE
ncbi:MAG: KH domain-containing protein, partial [Candidatus Riflebacteria bacterium]|nr:KH domain-containing protein [Candidatus Riflebacteria bacterium]